MIPLVRSCLYAFMYVFILKIFLVSFLRRTSPVLQGFPQPCLGLPGCLGTWPLCPLCAGIGGGMGWHRASEGPRGRSPADPSEPRRAGVPEWGHGGGTLGAVQPAPAGGLEMGSEMLPGEGEAYAEAIFLKSIYVPSHRNNKSLKPGFGAALSELLRRDAVYCRFTGARALCGLRRLPRPPRRGPWSVAVARVNYGRSLWPWILRHRLFLLSAAPRRCPRWDAVSLNPARLLTGA